MFIQKVYTLYKIELILDFHNDLNKLRKVISDLELKLNKINGVIKAIYFSADMSKCYPGQTSVRFEIKIESSTKESDTLFNVNNLLTTHLSKYYVSTI